MEVQKYYLSVTYIFIIAVVRTRANNYFWGFESDDGGWINTGGRSWQWSALALPDTSDIDIWIPCPTGTYIWLQDNETPPNTGTIDSPPDTNVTLYPNDLICITIYRHLNVFTGTDNPTLNLVTDGGTHKQQLLRSQIYDEWDTISLVCGPGDEPCCLTYPCTGYFSVDGEIDAHGDLLAFDNVGVNDGCELPTPSPRPRPPSTTTPPPPSWCCNFEDSSVCSWSLHFISNGWIWSGYVLPGGSYPTFSSDFIWIEDVEANTYSATIQDVSSETTFKFQYYYYTNRRDSNNHVQVAFRNSYEITTVWELDETDSHYWTTITVECDMGSTKNCCDGGSAPCYGNFYVETFARPGTIFGVGLDNFSVDNTQCAKT